HGSGFQLLITLSCVIMKTTEKFGSTIYYTNTDRHTDLHTHTNTDRYTDIYVPHTQTTDRRTDLSHTHIHPTYIHIHTCIYIYIYIYITLRFNLKFYSVRNKFTGIHH
ncbi:hypothetical protein LOAG_16281, partial [Loa loa]